MDTDLLEFGSDSAAADADLYNPVPGMGRNAVQSSNSSLDSCGKLNATVDKDDPITATPAQSSVPASASKPSPPMSHGAPAHSAHYKAPGPAADGVLPAVIIRPRPDLPPKTAAVPAIPPRKPRPAAMNPAADRSDALPSKAMQPQPPLPHVTPAVRKSTGGSVVNRTYGITVLDNPPQVLSNQCSVEANGSTPPVPVPRNTAAVNSTQPQASAASNLTVISPDSPVPCDSSDEQVRKYLFILILICRSKVTVYSKWRQQLIIRGPTVHFE